MENKAHAIAAGAFVLVVSALLVALAVWLTRDSSARLTYDISSAAAVTGLQPQASVRFRGVNVGKVTAIGFDPQIRGNVLVRIAVDAGTPVTQSTFASLGFQGVTGIAFVQLDDSGASKQLLATADDQPARIPMRPGLLDQLATQGTRILGQLEESSRRFNQLLSEDNERVLAASLRAMEQAAASLPPAMKEAGATFRTLRETAGSVSAGAEEFRQAAAEYGRLAQRVQEPGGILDQLRQGASALAATGQSTGALLPRVNNAVDGADRAARQVGRAAGTLADYPQALLYGPAPAVPGPGEPGFVVPGGGR